MKMTTMTTTMMTTTTTTTTTQFNVNILITVTKASKIQAAHNMTLFFPVTGVIKTFKLPSTGIRNIVALIFSIHDDI
jgi:hypothetical protein